MSASCWDAVHQELARWKAAGLEARFWLRDDDACDMTPQLDLLAAFAKRHGVQIGLAVVPGKLTKRLSAKLREEPEPFVPFCHGFMHTNYGPPAAPSEFGPDRPYAALQADAAHARAAFAEHFPELPGFFVPPYGRISEALSQRLPQLGFCALSNGADITAQRLARAHGLTNLLPANPLPAPRAGDVNVHVDPIDWRAKTAHQDGVIVRQLLGELRLRRKGYACARAPIGILTHHLVHDEAIWQACESVLACLRGSPAARFPELRELMREHQGMAASEPAVS